MGRLTSQILIAGVVLALASTGQAVAAGWTRFTPPAADSYSAPMGVARTADGTLHVLWIAGSGTTHESLMQTSFTPTGHVAATSTVSAGWSTLSPAGLAVSSDGRTLNAFWGGIIQNDPNHQEFNYAYSTDGGNSWTLTPEDLVTGQQVATDAAAATQLSGIFYESWDSYVHLGTTPAPAYGFTASPANDCCGYLADIAADPLSHQVLVAWYSNQSNYNGIYTQQIDPASGQPTGAVRIMPATLNVAPADEGPQVTGRNGAPGFVVAYGTGFSGGGYARDGTGGHAMLVWMVGRPHTTVLGRADDDVLAFTVTAGPSGRVWAVWAAMIGSRLKIVVRRSNPAVTAWGSPVVLAAPAVDVTTLSASGIGEALDVLAGADTGNQNRIAEYQTRVLAALTLTGPSRLARSGRHRVTLHVSDAGNPVRGARVSVGRVSARTNSKGVATLLVGPFSSRSSRVTASATLAGYTPAALVLPLH